MIGLVLMKTISIENPAMFPRTDRLGGAGAPGRDLPAWLPVPSRYTRSHAEDSAGSRGTALECAKDYPRILSGQRCLHPVHTRAGTGCGTTRIGFARLGTGHGT